MANYPIIEDVDLGRVSASVSDTTDCGLITESVDVTYDLGRDLYSYLYTQYPAPAVNDHVFTSVGRIATTVLSYNSTNNTIHVSAYPDMVFTRDDSKYQVWYVPTQKYIQPVSLTIVPTPVEATVTFTAEGYTQEGNSITVDEGTVVTYTVEAVGYETSTGTVTVTQRIVLPVSLSILSYTLTIITDPADATVTFDSGTVSGKSVTTTYNSEVNYTITRTGYDTVTGSWTATSDTSRSITMSRSNYTLSIAPNPADATVTFTAEGYTQEGNSITVPYGTTVSYSVNKTDYIPKGGTYTMDASNYNLPITIYEPLEYSNIDNNVGSTTYLYVSPEDQKVYSKSAGVYTDITSECSISPEIQLFWPEALGYRRTTSDPFNYTMDWLNITQFYNWDFNNNEFSGYPYKINDEGVGCVYLKTMPSSNYVSLSGVKVTAGEDTSSYTYEYVYTGFRNIDSGREISHNRPWEMVFVKPYNRYFIIYDNRLYTCSKLLQNTTARYSAYYNSSLDRTVYSNNVSRETMDTSYYTSFALILDDIKPATGNITDDENHLAVFYADPYTSSTSASATYYNAVFIRDPSKDRNSLT